MNKLLKTMGVALIISVSAQIYMEIMGKGFIVALSVIVLAIFLYAYEDLHPLAIGFFAGIFSPLFRGIVMHLMGTSVELSAMTVLPEVGFFFTYGIIYYGAFRQKGVVVKSLKTFPIVIMLCDFFGNVVEITLRCIVFDDSLISFNTIKYLLIIAMVRTILIEAIILAIDSYGSLLIRKEHDDEYKKLLNLASVFESELYLMEKNAADTEMVMKKAYDLYRGISEEDYNPELKDLALQVSAEAHEIKSDYFKTISALRENFTVEYQMKEMPIEDIVYILKYDIKNRIKRDNLKIDITAKINAKFFVEDHFDFMSVLRNLILNSMDAIGKENGTIKIFIDEKGDQYRIAVRDTGKGIPEKNIPYLFTYGYSTKYNETTGNVKRGIGLHLVEDLVKTRFCGTIEVFSALGEFTEFVINVPKEVFREEE